MANEIEPVEITVQAGTDTYVVRRVGNELQVGRSAGGSMLWQDETVPVDRLPERARAALERGDTGSADLQLALQAVAEAFAQRGG